MDQKTKITIVGAGYVGMSLAVLLAQKNEVLILDIDVDRVDKVNNKQSTVNDAEIETFLQGKSLDLSATLNKGHAYKDAEFIIVATPTDHDIETNSLDTTSVDEVVEEALQKNDKALVVIKSTIPLGHTQYLQEKLNTDRVVFSPEFLREGKALEDHLYPSRIIVGSELNAAKKFVELLKQAAIKKDIETLFILPREAEAVKLFANSYLAMRVSFFNELDSLALALGLDTQSIIKGVCLDDRIGNDYNNPSFGYGGYCLPKDTKQLLTTYNKVPQKLIQAIVSSNTTRKDFIANEIIKRNPKTVGIYRLTAKAGSHNFRSAAILGVMRRIKEEGIDVVVYEPFFDGRRFFNSKIINKLEEFKMMSDLILVNRFADELNDVKDKIFTRDIFRKN